MGMENFMKLEKIQSPTEWIDQMKKLESDIVFYDDVDKALDSQENHIILTVPYKKFMFYDLFDAFDAKEKCKIYPILNNEYWVAEVINNG